MIQILFWWLLVSSGRPMVWHRQDRSWPGSLARCSFYCYPISLLLLVISALSRSLGTALLVSVFLLSVRSLLERYHPSISRPRRACRVGRLVPS